MSPGLKLSSDVLRSAAAKRVEETTLRETADEIGMSFSGLRSFIDGGSPQKKTIQKLVAWFYKRSAKANAPQREDLEVAIAQILGYVDDPSMPKSVRDRRREEIIEILKQ